MRRIRSMPPLTELLEEAVGELPADVDLGNLERRARHRTARRRIGRRLGAAVVTVALVAIAMVVIDGPSGRRVATARRPRGVLPVATKTVLVLDDGNFGMTLVDLDRRVAVRRVLKGNRPGDQPYKLIRAGDALIAGWGGVYATPLDGTRPRVLGDVGEATVFIPAAEPGRVWLIDTAYQRVNEAVTTHYREVDVATGAILLDVPGPSPSVGTPRAGIPGGVALEAPNGVVLWHPGELAMDSRLGRGTSAGLVADAAGDLLASCEAPCTTLSVTDSDGGNIAVSAGSIIPGGRFDAHSARFSPGGRFLAAMAYSRFSGGAARTLVVVDTSTGTRETVVYHARTAVEECHGCASLAYPTSLAWGSRGRVFLVSSDPDSPASIASYDVQSKRLATGELPFSLALSTDSLVPSVALDQAEARQLLKAPLRKREHCIRSCFATDKPYGFKF
jgi:hypothetical protein